MQKTKEYFPDGTRIDDWFYDIMVPALEDMGKPYSLTEYNIKDDGTVQTKEIQQVIDMIYEQGGGVLVIPKGTYRTGSLYFKQGVHLYVLSYSCVRELLVLQTLLTHREVLFHL